MLLIGSQLESFRSLKDKTLKITFETQEPNGTQLVNIANLIGRFGFLAFKEDVMKETDKKLLEGLKSDYEDTGKTKSQRLRGVLYRCWEQENKGYEVFDDYYNYQMERLIMFYKDKLE